MTMELARTQNFYGHGKLLLSGEYLVNDGALALAIPTQMGQRLQVKYEPSFGVPLLHWVSVNNEGEKWFDAYYEFWHFNIVNSKGEALENPPEEQLFLQKILKQVRKQNPHFLRDGVNVFVETHIEFPLNWAMGSVSTLIYTIAEWAYVAPFELFNNVFNGSRYGIACAQADGPILYKENLSGPNWEVIQFYPEFSDNLYFVHIGREKNKEPEFLEAEKKLNNDNNLKGELVVKLSSITRELVKAKNLEEFDFLLKGHEKIISKSLGLPAVKDRLFPEFWGEAKSLGIWGGDFVLVTSKKSQQETMNYFSSQGFNYVLPFKEMVKK